MAGNGGPLALPGPCPSGVDSGKAEPGRQVYSVRCTNAIQPSFGGGNTNVQTASFRGRRVRLSAWLKVEDFESMDTIGPRDGAGLFMTNTNVNNVDLRADVSETSGWRFRELVMDVPRGSRGLLIGLSLGGTGQVWARDLNFEEVSP